MNNQYAIDTELKLQDAGLVAASAAGTNILDLGAGTVDTATAGYTDGNVFLNVTALEVASGDEFYTIHYQLSNDADFGTDTNIHEGGSIAIGADGARSTDANAADDAVGIYLLPFINERAGTLYRYLRLYIVVAGTIATGINFEAYLVKNPAR